MGNQFIKAGAVFLILGALSGVAMHHLHSRGWIVLHAHSSLVGGFLMLIFGLFYRSCSAAGKSLLARWHFWLFTASVSILFFHTLAAALGGRSFEDAGAHALSIMVAVVGVAFLVALLLFAINVFRNCTTEV